VDELPQQSVIEPVELLPELGWCLQQKPAQALRIGIVSQAGEVLKGAIAAQERGRLQAVQPQDDGVDQPQQHLRQTIVLVASGIVQMPMNEMPQLQQSQKFVEEENAAIVRQTLVIKGDRYVSWRSSHAAFHLTKSEVKGRILNLDQRPVKSGPKPLQLSIFTPDSSTTEGPLKLR
jgi:hypothetical protein